MDFRRQRSHQFLCQKWTIFTVSLTILLSCVLLAALSNKIADNYVQSLASHLRSDVKKDALEQALTGMAVLTGFFSLFGMMGAIKENYCATMTFAIYYTINTVANFYVAFQANGLWLYAIINLCIAIISFNFAKHLRAQRLLRSLSTSAFVIDPSSYPHQTIVVPVGHEWTTRVVRQQWVSDPPPYTSHEFTENPYNTKHYIP